MHFITIDVIRKQYQSLDPCILNNKQDNTIQLNKKNLTWHKNNQTEHQGIV